MRIAVFGAGGVGGYLGGRLARAGEDVVFIARGSHLRALQAGGLRVRSPEGDFALPSVEAAEDPAGVGQVDLILLAVKSWQVTGATRASLPMLGPETFVLPLQNGVEAAGQVDAVLGAGRALKGLARIISHIGEPGEIVHVGVEPSVAFGERDNRRSDRARKLLELFRRSGVRAEIPPDIDAALWKKLLFVASAGGLGAVTRAPIGVIRSVPETRRLMERAMQEVLDTARARGIRLKESLIPNSMAFVDSVPAEGTASLQRDITAGRPSELEAWNGAVVRMGADAGVPTPIHGFIYSCLLPLELRTRGSLNFEGRGEDRAGSVPGKAPRSGERVP
jgi:2-dehydropantoate 2-reductase